MKFYRIDSTAEQTLSMSSIRFVDYADPSLVRIEQNLCLS